MVAIIRKRVLYPEKDIYGEGEIVAMGYISKKSLYPIYTVRSYSQYYYANVAFRKTIIIRYDDTKLRRLQRKINKKEKQGYMTYEQGVKVILTTVCNMIEQQLIGTFL